MNNIKAVIFDLYGTLIHTTNPTNPYTNLFYDLDLNSDEKFTKAKETAITNNFSSLSELIDKIKPGSTINTLPYEQDIKKELHSTIPYKETIQVLNQLKNNNIKLGLISNLASPYKEPFFRLGIDRYFDATIFSCDENLSKPNPQIYQNMLNLLKATPKETLMTGDKKHNDVDGPTKVGINGIHLDRKYNNTNTISSLDEILKHI